jgi:hypothetical protein
MAPLHAYVGSDVESLAVRRASRRAAVIFGFFHERRSVRDDHGEEIWRSRENVDFLEEALHPIVFMRL